MDVTQRYLILEDGTVYPGSGFGAAATTTGEVVFNTSMVGYQEIVTNQIYHNQIIVYSQPIIGATGIYHDGYESILPTAKGMVVRSVSNISKNRQRSLSLDQFLKQHNIPGISGVDTRQLIHKLQQVGTVKGSIVDLADDHAFDQLHATVLTNQQVTQVATPKPYANPNTSFNVVVIDYGLKHGILRQLSSRHCNVTVLPWDVDAQSVISLDPDGVILSTGPGSPLDLPENVLETIQTLQERMPLFAIGLGHELFALANGATLKPLETAHHGPNHPIRKIITNEIIYAQEAQEFVVDPESVDKKQLITTYIDLIDGSIQGLRHRDFPAFSVQFFPDGAPGPNDSVDLFDEFMEIMSTREGSHG